MCVWVCVCARLKVVIKKSDCLGCSVLLALFIGLTLLASFFLPSHLSLIHVNICAV